MKTYTKEQLAEILRKHSQWACGEGGERANMIGADMIGADMRGADMYRANMSGANMIGADMRGANMCGANMCGANMYRANMIGANMRGAKRFGKTLLHHAKFDGLYKYTVEIAVCTDSSVIVKMGCKELTLQEWETNWFNNDGEFPNDGSAKTKHRIAAYNYSVNYARIEGWIDRDGKAVIE